MEVYSWEDHLFLWAIYTMAMLVITRGYILSHCRFDLGAIGTEGPVWSTSDTAKEPGPGSGKSSVLSDCCSHPKGRPKHQSPPAPIRFTARTWYLASWGITGSASHAKSMWPWEKKGKKTAAITLVRPDEYPFPKLTTHMPGIQNELEKNKKTYI